MKNPACIELIYEQTFFKDGSLLRGSLYFNTKELAIKYMELESVRLKLALRKQSQNRLGKVNFEIFVADSDFMQIRYFIDYEGIQIFATEKDFSKKIPNVWFTQNEKWLEENK